MKSDLNDETDKIEPVSCSFQDSSLLRMDSIHGKIVLSKSLSEQYMIDSHSLGASPSKPMVVGSLRHSESSPFKEVIPHSVLQKQLSKDSINSSSATADNNQKIDLENEGEPCFQMIGNAFNENKIAQPEINLLTNDSKSENLDDVDSNENESNNSFEQSNNNEALLKGSLHIDEPNCLNESGESHDQNNSKNSMLKNLLSQDNDLNNDDSSDSTTTKNTTAENSTDGPTDDNHKDISITDSMNDIRNTQEDSATPNDAQSLEKDSSNISLLNNRSQSKVSVESFQQRQQEDTNYDVLPSPDTKNQITKQESKIYTEDGDRCSENAQSIGGSQQMVDVLKLGTSVNSANDFFIPGIHASPPLEPETTTNADVDESACSNRLKTGSFPREERLSGVLGTSFESSGNFSDSGSDCFSEQSFSLLADLGITDDFIGIKENHFSTEVLFVKQKTYRVS